MRPENDFGSAEILELMHFRDQVFASAAEEAERSIRYSLMKDRVQKLEAEFIEQTDLLRENMTRAYNAEKKIVEFVGGKLVTTYRLKDWIFSRQRYWGEPIPVIHCTTCGVVPVPEKDLPVKLPDDVSFDGRGNPITNHPTWKNCKCPKCAKPALRETDTFDTFFESSWYFLWWNNTFWKITWGIDG